MPIASRFKNLKQVQEKEQLDQGILLDKENITMAAVTRVNADNFETFHVLPHLKEVDQSKWMVTQDQDQIDQLIPLFDQENIDGDWEIGVYDSDSRSFVTSFRLKQEQLPSFVSDYFK